MNPIQGQPTRVASQVFQEVIAFLMAVFSLTVAGVIGGVLLKAELTLLGTVTCRMIIQSRDETLTIRSLAFRFAASAINLNFFRLPWNPKRSEIESQKWQFDFLNTYFIRTMSELVARPEGGGNSIC